MSFTTPTLVASLRAGDQQSAIDVVTAFMRSYTRQTLTLVDDDALTVWGTPGRRLFLGERPVVSISSPILVDGVALSDSEWRWNSRGVLWRREGWCDDVTPVEVTYTHGFAELPDDLAAVCRSAAMRLSNNPQEMIRYEIVGDFNKTLASPIFDFSVAELIVLNRYCFNRHTWP